MPVTKTSSGLIDRCHDNEGKLSFSQSLFKIPFFNGRTIDAKPYKKFSNGFSIGLSDENAKVSLRQNERGNFFESPPDHSFSLTVDIEDTAHSKWITLEGDLDITRLSPSDRLTTLVALKSSTQSEFTLDLRLYRKSGGLKDLHIGKITPKRNGEYTSATVSALLGSLCDIIQNDLKSASLLLFFPVESRQSHTLYMFNVLLTERELD